MLLIYRSTGRQRLYSNTIYELYVNINTELQTNTNIN